MKLIGFVSALAFSLSVLGQHSTSVRQGVGGQIRQFEHPGGEFEFLPFEPSLIENLRLLGDSPVNLIVISNVTCGR